MTSENPKRGRERQILGRRRGDRGFTLLEIMVVLAIIAVVFGGIGAAIFKGYRRSLVNAAKLRVKAVREASAQYMMDNSNNCPRSVEDLVSQKYLDKNNGKDPWGKEYTYRCPGTNDPDNADVVSAGPDKQEGTADDIKSWDQ